MISPVLRRAERSRCCLIQEKRAENITSLVRRLMRTASTTLPQKNFIIVQSQLHPDEEDEFSSLSDELAIAFLL